MGGIGGGEVVVHLRCAGSDVLATRVRLTRPLQVLQSLNGREPQACLRLLPLLFPLCGSAHALAGLAAFEHALEVQPAPTQQAARQIIALADALAAHVWRVQLDWAHLAGHTPDPARVAQARRLVSLIAAALYPDGDWLAIGGGRLASSAAALQDAHVQLLALVAAIDVDRALAALRARIAGALIGADPNWAPRLHTCFAQMAASTRAAARLLEGHLVSAARLPSTPAADSRPWRPKGVGHGQVETARGALHYAIHLEAGRVTACTVSAPVDRTYAPDGPAAALLAQLTHAQNPALAAKWILAACDPCIDVRVEIES